MIQDRDRQSVERLKRLMLQHGVLLYKTIVLGPRERQDAKVDSDLGVLVLVDNADAPLRKIISHCGWEVSFDTDVLIQTVVMTRQEAESGPEQSSLLMLAV